MLNNILGNIISGSSNRRPGQHGGPGVLARGEGGVAQRGRRAEARAADCRATGHPEHCALGRQPLPSIIAVCTHQNVCILINTV